MQIFMNMRDNGSFTLGSVIDEKSSVSIVINTSASDYKTCQLLESAAKYIKEQGLQVQAISTAINQILVGAGCKSLSLEQTKELLTVGTVKATRKESDAIIGEEPLKDLSQAMGSN